MTPARRRWAFLMAAAVVVVVLVGGRWLALETAERAWAQSIRGGGVYLTGRDLARLVRGVILLLSVAWGTGNLYFVYRAIGSVQMPRRLGDIEIVEAVPQRVLLAGTIASGLVFGSLLTWGTGDWWLHATLAGSPPRFGAVDPVLHRDLGYYVAQLPWAGLRQGYALLATTTALVLVALLYLGMGSLRFAGGRPLASPHARVHLSVLLACLAVALAWGAVLDPAEVVAGLHGPLDRAALDVRLPGAAVLAVVSAAVAIASLAWGWWERPGLLVGSWAALVGSALAVYLLLPAIVRGARGTSDEREPVFVAERRTLEDVALGTAWLEQRAPPAFPAAEAAVAAVPVWDARRVALVARRARSQLLGARATVAAAALFSALPAARGRAAWLVTPAPDDVALAQAQASPSWTEIHRGSWAQTGPPLAAVETDTGIGLAFERASATDSACWFGPGFTAFAVAAPDTWPAARAGGIPLAGWWRRTALAWALQSPELVRGETDGLLLLWRRDVSERLSRLAPFVAFDPPAPLLTDSPGALWWIAYGYVRSETFPLVGASAWVDAEGDRSAPVRYVHAGLIGAVNAASGDTRLYLAPGYDSLTAAWARLFAPLVEPLDSLPADLRTRLPYPRRAFEIAAAVLARSSPDSAGWAPRPREPFDLTAPPPPAGPAGRREPAGELRVWTAQGFETGTPARFAGLLAGTMSPQGPRLFLWRPGDELRLPSALLGSPETSPGVLRLWLAGESLLSLQGLFAQPVAGGGEGVPRLIRTYVSWGDRLGEGATPAAAWRDLVLVGARQPADSSLAARWEAARRLAAQADSALAAGDLERFGRLYAALKQLLGIGRRPLAPTLRRD